MKLRAAAGIRSTATIFIVWLCVALFFEYARPASYFGSWLIPFNSLLPLSLLAVSFFVQGARPFGEIFRDPSAKWLTTYMVLIAIAVPLSTVRMQSYLVLMIALGYYILFLLLARILTTRAHLTAVILTLTVAHVFLIAMNPAVVTNPTVRSYIIGATFLGDGNDFSLSLCLLVPLLMAVALRANSKMSRLGLWGVVTLLLLAIIGSQSRGATLGMAAVLLFLWWHGKRRALGLLALLPVVVLVAVYAPANYFERMGTIAKFQEEGSAQGRIIAWKASVRMALDNPVTGVGPGMFPVAFGTTYYPKTSERLPWLTAHSMYFLILGEMGFPGIIVLIGILVSNLRANTRLRNKLLVHLQKGPDPPAQSSARTLLMLNGGVIGLMVSGAFLSASYYPHLFVMTGLLLAHRAMLRADFPFLAEPASTLPPGRRRRLLGARDAAAGATPGAAQ